MRDVTKSFFRLSWAMTVFGVDQFARLVRPEEESGADNESSDDVEDRVARAMDSVSDNTEKHLDKRAQSMFEAGDKLQSEMVDLFFESFEPEQWKPRKVLQRAADWADKSAETMRDVASRSESEADEKAAS